MLDYAVVGPKYRPRFDAKTHVHEVHTKLYAYTKHDADNIHWYNRIKWSKEAKTQTFFLK
jgi:hypothetical protein